MFAVVHKSCGAVLGMPIVGILRGVRILVSGNQGYVGSAFTNLISAEREHFELVGIDTGFFTFREKLKPGTANHGSFLQISGDIRDSNDIPFDGVDAVVHLAAISNDPMGALNERVTLDVNLNGTTALARAAKAAGVKHFVFASSCSVYGQSGEEYRSELDPTEPLSAYAKSKVSAEEALASMAGPDFLVSSLRFATAAGWSENLRSDLVVNDLALGALRDGRILLQSDGLAWRPIIDVSDMARAILWRLEQIKRIEDFSIINIGSENGTYTIREIADRIASLVPGAEVQFANSSNKDHRSYRVSFERMNELGGFSPRVSLNDTILGLVNRWTQIKDRLPTDFVRLHRLTALKEDGKIDGGLRWVGRVR